MLPEEYEAHVKDELWGCFKYIGIPMDTLMKMPIQDRKYYIRRHNNDIEKKNNSNHNGEIRYEGEALNNYARLEQSNNKVRGGKFN